MNASYFHPRVCVYVCACKVISFVMDGKLGWIGVVEVERVIITSRQVGKNCKFFLRGRNKLHFFFYSEDEHFFFYPQIS